MNAAEAIDQPFRLVDGKGGWLEVRRVTVTSRGLPVLSTGGQGYAVDPLEIPAITAKLYEAAGHQPPVMLGRPEVDPAQGVHCGPLRAWLTGDGEIAVAVGASQSSAAPSVIRQFAAASVVLADAAETGPDAAEVDELACMVMEVLNPGAMGLDGARPLARKILLAGWKREAGHG